MAMAVRGATQGLKCVPQWKLLLGSVSTRSMASTSTASSIHPEEPTIVKPQERKKILVLGGNGFVGSHVCMEALGRGLPVVSLNRSGRPDNQETWVNDVVWVRGDLLEPSRWEDSLKEVQAVISCVGCFDTNEQVMLRINGEANRSAVWAASQAGVKRFVYISAADFGLPSFVLKGYFEGKKIAEEAVRLKFPYGGVILRPGWIHGNVRVKGWTIPLSAIGTPLEMIMRNAKAATQIPIIGPSFVPPVNVTTVAKAAVRAAIDNAIPSGVLDVWSIMRLGDQ